jgi:hypothetical protein
MFDIAANLVRVFTALLKVSRPLRIGTIFVSAILLLLSVVLFLNSIFYLFPMRKDDSVGLGVGLLFVSVLCVALVAVASSPALSNALSVEKPFQNAELEPILRERHRIQEKISHDREPNIFDTIELNLNQLNEYYTINKSQARRSFAASLFAIVAGLVVIITSIVLPEVSGGAAMSTRTYVGGISGVILQFIGGAYFYLYNRSLAQLNFFFSRLSITQDTMLAIKLCDNLPDTESRGVVLSQIISALLSRDQVVTDFGASRKATQRTKARVSRQTRNVTQGVSNNNKSTGDGLQSEEMGLHPIR